MFYGRLTYPLGPRAQKLLAKYGHIYADDDLSGLIGSQKRAKKYRKIHHGHEPDPDRLRSATPIYICWWAVWEGPEIRSPFVGPSRWPPLAPEIRSPFVGPRRWPPPCGYPWSPGICCFGSGRQGCNMTNDVGRGTRSLASRLPFPLAGLQTYHRISIQDEEMMFDSWWVEDLPASALEEIP